MPHNKDLQKKLHETRAKITLLELKIEDLWEERVKYQEKIKQIDTKIKDLKKEIALLERAK